VQIFRESDFEEVGNCGPGKCFDDINALVNTFEQHQSKYWQTQSFSDQLLQP
jgi:hypothetical protein